jgi:hypothetical protein
MLASALILAFSVVLFVYWFRYTCLLVLSAKSGEQYAEQVAAANRLSFPDVQEKLRAQSADLDRLREMLEMDYRILQYLREHAAGFGMRSFEQRMLAFDYRLMQLWYRLMRKKSAGQARGALEEMARIVGYFAHKMGEHSASYSHAA